VSTPRNCSTTLGLPPKPSRKPCRDMLPAVRTPFDIDAFADDLELGGDITQRRTRNAVVWLFDGEVVMGCRNRGAAGW